MNIIEITNLDTPGVEVFSSLTERQLRSHLVPSEALFIAESPKVIRIALNAGYTPVSMLCERRHITGDAADIIKCVGEIPIYTGSRELLKSLTGYALTRGVLCAMHRPMPKILENVCHNAHRICVIDSVSDTTNIGAIFRSAAALGIDAVLLTPSSCDPLNRRSIRVSMGSVFLVPWTWVDEDLNDLRSLGFKIAAMALHDNSVWLDDTTLHEIDQLAIVVGSEGDGLSQQAIDSADIVIKIPMAHNVDSLNVAAAAAVAFWQLARHKPSQLS